MDTFLEVVEGMSLRDLMKIASFDTKERQRGKALKVNSMSFSTELPIFSLILLMIECGLDNDSIVNELTSYYDYDSSSFNFSLSCSNSYCTCLLLSNLFNS